jgi:hypothetical protein
MEHMEEVEIMRVSAQTLVPGDVLELEPGVYHVVSTVVTYVTTYSMLGRMTISLTVICTETDEVLSVPSSWPVDIVARR